MAASRPMFFAWLHHITQAFARRWLPVLAAIVFVRLWFDGLQEAEHLLPLTLAIVAGLACVSASWTFWREQRRRGRRFG